MKRGREGVPIIIDDLAKGQYGSNSQKIIKDDSWGISERFENYPAVIITTNKLASITQDISKRAVICHIDLRLSKETANSISKRVNDSIKKVGTALFGEYVRRMLTEIEKLENDMKTAESRRRMFLQFLQTSSAA